MMRGTAPDEVLTLLELVGTITPGLSETLGGVNGTKKPGSAVVCTLAANCAKVLLPVVGGLIAPYML